MEDVTWATAEPMLGPTIADTVRMAENTALATVDAYFVLCSFMI